jgi:hypothetical protein
LNVELRHLQHFIVVAEERSFTRAAERPAARSCWRWPGTAGTGRWNGSDREQQSSS